MFFVSFLIFVSLCNLFISENHKKCVLCLFFLHLSTGWVHFGVWLTSTRYAVFSVKFLLSWMCTFLNLTSLRLRINTIYLLEIQLTIIKNPLFKLSISSFSFIFIIHYLILDTHLNFRIFNHNSKLKFYYTL